MRIQQTNRRIKIKTQKTKQELELYNNEHKNQILPTPGDYIGLTVRQGDSTPRNKREAFATVETRTCNLLGNLLGNLLCNML